MNTNEIETVLYGDCGEYFQGVYNIGLQSTWTRIDVENILIRLEGRLINISPII